MSSSARRALQILQEVGAAGRPIGVADVAWQLRLAGGTAFRSLDALERGGYLRRYQASARFVPGPIVQRLRQRLFASFPIRDVAMPYLRQLAFASGETASLTVPIGDYGVRIAAAPGTNEVTSSPPLGRVARLHEHAAGLAILAHRPHLPDPAGDNGAGSRAVPASLAAELARIRDRGFAIQEMPFAHQRSGLALPVRAPQGAVAAIAIEGPVLDLSQACYHDDLPRWIGVVGALEALIRTRPELACNPFDHLDPKEIVLRSAG